MGSFMDQSTNEFSAECAVTRRGPFWNKWVSGVWPKQMYIPVELLLAAIK